MVPGIFYPAELNQTCTPLEKVYWCNSTRRANCRGKSKFSMATSHIAL